MRHRIAGLGGVWDIRCPESGGTVITARIPMARMLPPLPVAEGGEALASKVAARQA